MGKDCEESRAERGNPRSSGLTWQATSRSARLNCSRDLTDYFLRSLRCRRLKTGMFPARPRLVSTKNSAVLRGRIYEFMTLYHV